MSKPWSREDPTPGKRLAGAIASLLFGIVLLLIVGDATGGLIVGIVFIAIGVWQGYEYLDERDRTR